MLLYEMFLFVFLFVVDELNIEHIIIQREQLYSAGLVNCKNSQYHVKLK